jgi:hypothetical protein
MGRPVFHEYTLDALVAASWAVAHVERASPRERIEERDGLRAVLWPLRIVEVLYVNEAPVPAGGISRAELLPVTRELKAGEFVDVLVNRVNLVDQANRRHSASGASFPAQRYPGDVRTADGPAWIAFLIERAGQLELTAQGAFVALAELPAVREAVRLAEAALPTRKIFRKDMLTPGHR